MENQAAIAPPTGCCAYSATSNHASGLCRAESGPDPLFMGKSHTTRHNPVPGIMPIMPGAA